MKKKTNEKESKRMPQKRKIGKVKQDDDDEAEEEDEESHID